VLGWARDELRRRVACLGRNRGFPFYLRRQVFNEQVVPPRCVVKPRQPRRRRWIVGKYAATHDGAYRILSWFERTRPVFHVSHNAVKQLLWRGCIFRNPDDNLLIDMHDIPSHACRTLSIVSARPGFRNLDGAIDGIYSNPIFKPIHYWTVAIDTAGE
jgi:hypothetical protein